MSFDEQAEIEVTSETWIEPHTLEKLKRAARLWYESEHRIRQLTAEAEESRLMRLWRMGL